MRFSMGEYHRKILWDMVKARDRECEETYEKILKVPVPYDDVEVHHFIHRGSGGDDKEENLISLSWYTHRCLLHGLAGEVRREMEKRIKAYLESEAVLAWRRAHKEELEELYARAAGAKEKAGRKKHMLKKKKGWLY